MSTANRLAEQLKEKNPAFQEVWDDPERKREFELSCKLVELRSRLQMTQQEFADCVGVKQSYLSRLENGEVNMTIGKLENLVQKLGGHVTIDIDIDEDQWIRHP
ncbi:helix-turn-helix transcriptional regulator [Salicibibacter cibarius]|uniref:Helix-turn-helix transcriptional regulator n=1 Tax=Salicibibacter cibarius TaxID=2743000 RepID=A0A7T6Z066_9BACI|nr:helix-turn-helix transcriptional regulator [Salicibibacter cibarius]QQK74469.1 helix-turn-helix transcriptional regulator [Salicibibacter cibarius]